MLTGQPVESQVMVLSPTLSMVDSSVARVLMIRWPIGLGSIRDTVTCSELAMEIIWIVTIRGLLPESFSHYRGRDSYAVELNLHFNPNKLLCCEL